jgi:CRISPR/Cas system-associated protein Cas10 (large subunit of type III CRISPR-Cas system)
MNESKYLYGASVQGIQDFIFKTNKLREIVGASELVEQICTSKFKEAVKFKESNLILSAAGNIKYIFDTEQECKDLVRSFPKEIIEFAPGITISQAVVKMDEQTTLPKAINDLEKKLKAQRNRSLPPFEIGYIGLERSRRTGGVAYGKTKHEDENADSQYVCEATHLKTEAFDKSQNAFFEKLTGITIDTSQHLANEMEEITASGKNNWLAVVHADGNALGILIQKLGETLKSLPDTDTQEAFVTFSKNLDIATRNAAQKAFKEVVENAFDKNSYKYPIRPVILGGDDVTAILRADLALNFTHIFLKEFEIETKEKLQFLKNVYKVEGFENGLTACAGIVYVKATYPFHYAVSLADTLCSEAKKETKKLIENTSDIIPKSNLLFYKIQESFIDDWKELRQRTLRAKDVDFAFGPYYVDETQSPSLKYLNDKLSILENAQNDDGKSVSKLRQWLSELYIDTARADFFLDRMKEVNKDFYKDLNLDNEKTNDKENHKTMIYDLIQLDSFKH